MNPPACKHRRVGASPKGRSGAVKACPLVSVAPDLDLGGGEASVSSARLFTYFWPPECS